MHQDTSPRPGPAPMAPHLRRDKVIQVCVTARELTIIQAAARDDDSVPSQYVRRIVVPVAERAIGVGR